MNSSGNKKQELGMNYPIYRYISLERVEEMIKKGKNIIPNPAKFSDPLEMLYMDVLNKNIADRLENIFVQCWTREKTSDAMWQAYSRTPETPGVRIRTKVGKIVNPLMGKAKYKIEEVKYLTMADFKKKRDSISEQNCELAKAFMFKHNAFKYEKEIRFICWGCRANEDSGFYSYPIRPNDVIDQIMIDPQASTDKFEEIREKLKAIDFPEGKIESSIRFRARALARN